MDHEQQKMGNEDRLLRGRKCIKAGVCGSIVATLCCVTPLLAIALASVGLATIVPYLDYILVPALLICLLLAFYGWLTSRDDGDHHR